MSYNGFEIFSIFEYYFLNRFHFSYFYIFFMFPKSHLSLNNKKLLSLFISTLNSKRRLITFFLTVKFQSEIDQNRYKILLFDVIA